MPKATKGKDKDKGKAPGRSGSSRQGKGKDAQEHHTASGTQQAASSTSERRESTTSESIYATPETQLQPSYVTDTESFPQSRQPSAQGETSNRHEPPASSREIGHREERSQSPHPEIMKMFTPNFHMKGFFPPGYSRADPQGHTTGPELPQASSSLPGLSGASRGKAPQMRPTLDPFPGIPPAGERRFPMEEDVDMHDLPDANDPFAFSQSFTQGLELGNIPALADPSLQTEYDWIQGIDLGDFNLERIEVVPSPNQQMLEDPAPIDYPALSFTRAPSEGVTLMDELQSAYGPFERQGSYFQWTPSANLTPLVAQENMMAFQMDMENTGIAVTPRTGRSSRQPESVIFMGSRQQTPVQAGPSQPLGDTGSTRNPDFGTRVEYQPPLRGFPNDSEHSPLLKAPELRPRVGDIPLGELDLSSRNYPNLSQALPRVQNMLSKAYDLYCQTLEQELGREYRNIFMTRKPPTFRMITVEHCAELAKLMGPFVEAASKYKSRIHLPARKFEACQPAIGAIDYYGNFQILPIPSPRYWPENQVLTSYHFRNPAGVWEFRSEQEIAEASMQFGYSTEDPQGTKRPLNLQLLPYSFQYHTKELVPYWVKKPGSHEIVNVWAATRTDREQWHRLDASSKITLDFSRFSNVAIDTAVILGIRDMHTMERGTFDRLPIWSYQLVIKTLQILQKKATDSITKVVSWPSFHQNTADKILRQKLFGFGTPRDPRIDQELKVVSEAEAMGALSDRPETKIVFSFRPWFNVRQILAWSFPDRRTGRIPPIIICSTVDESKDDLFSTCNDCNDFWGCEKLECKDPISPRVQEFAKLYNRFDVGESDTGNPFHYLSLYIDKRIPLASVARRADPPPQSQQGESSVRRSVRLSRQPGRKK